MEDVEFLSAFKGKRVKLTLKTSSYLGVVQRINPNKTLILADVVIGTNGCKIPGSKLFFGHEIVNVEFTKEANSDSGLEEHLNVEKFQPYRKTITYDDDEDEEESINFVVIDEFTEKFGHAVMHIKTQHVIGVGVDGVEVYKHGRLCWLQIATKYKVYLFDILLLGTRAFKNGLSMILENKRILKVIHDCRAIGGCLMAHFGVNLTNVFDTQVADVMCFYSETGGFLPDRVSTLQEVVSLHLKVPSSQLLSLQMKSQLTKEEREMWQKRPCPVPLLKVMALSVIHLQPLRLVLLDALMTDYLTLVDSYLNSSYHEPGELEHIAMESVMDLPGELRQLEQMHCERQKWAAERYPVTERGLLARFNPRSQSPPETPAQELGQTRADTSGPVPSSTQEAPLVHNPPTRPHRVTHVSSPCPGPAAQASVPAAQAPVPAAQAPVPAAQASVPATESDLRSEMSVNSHPSPGVGRGHTEALMNTMGRGRPFGKQQSPVPAFPTMGRGFLLQMPQAQIPKENTGTMESPGRTGTSTSCAEHTHTQEVMPKSDHWLSFRSFRY